jgi:hypothetical protein
MEHIIDWHKSPNGVMLCTYERTIELMPEVQPILDELFDSDDLELNKNDYAIDVKIHMLMPGQFPCIPNWHRDFVPRDENLKKNSKKVTGEKMYMWLSGAPLTEYMDKEGNITKKEPQQWHSFTQSDIHKGTVCEEHTWRCFIRVIPKKFIHPSTVNINKTRIHTQVYLDAAKFKW